METNSETKVYRVCLYKNNSIKTSEFDSEGISCITKRKVDVFEDFKGNVGLTAIGDTEEEALKAIISELERNVDKAFAAIGKWYASIDVLNDKLKEVNRK